MKLQGKSQVSREISSLSSYLLEKNLAVMMYSTPLKNKKGLMFKKSFLPWAGLWTVKEKEMDISCLKSKFKNL